MTAIAPPPVGTEAEPSVQLDNAHALRALDALRGPDTPAPAARRLRAKLATIGAVLGVAVATLVAGAFAGWFAAKKQRRFAGWLARG